MPREILEFRVVVASPSDVYDARRAVFEGIYELNRMFETQRIAVRGMGWEEYVTPGIGAETQAVVGNQLLRDYDILIAIFGAKLGTPTANALSGTVEEIEHAIANSGSPMGPHRVQIYFLDKIDSASSISIDELKQVADFRKQLEPKGILYRLFKTEQELQREIRVNVQRSILEYLSKTSHIPPHPSAKDIGQAADGQFLLRKDDDAGVLDFQEEGEEAITTGIGSIGRMSNLLTEITEATNHQTSEIEKLSLASAKEKKGSINKYATFIEERANTLKKEASIARQNFSTFSQTLISLAALQKQSGDPQAYQNDISPLLEAADSMLVTLATTRTAMEEFKSSVQKLPRITSQFNRSKRILIEAVDECIELLDRTEHNMYEIAEGI